MKLILQYVYFEIIKNKKCVPVFIKLSNKQTNPCVKPLNWILAQKSDFETAGLLHTDIDNNIVWPKIAIMSDNFD